MISNEYRAILRDTHAKYERWGTSARKHIDNVLNVGESVGAKTVLDYGCGKGELRRVLDKLGAIDGCTFIEYDPGIPGKDTRPAGHYDLVCCLDVMEHVEPEHLQEVMRNLVDVVGKVGFFLISTRHASGVLSDGRNAHLIVEPAKWWKAVFAAHFPRVEMVVNNHRAEAYIIVASEDYEGEIAAVVEPKIKKGT